MKKNVLVVFFAIALALMWNVGAAKAVTSPTCPNPAPSCTTSGTLNHFNGTFACTAVDTSSSGLVTVAIMVVVSGGTGTYTASAAVNQNDPSNSTSTFIDFTAEPSGTYCLNTDDTGYVFPTGGCPMALVIDNAHTEGRIIDTTESSAQAVVCSKR